MGDISRPNMNAAPPQHGETRINHPADTNTYHSGPVDNDVAKKMGTGAAGRAGTVIKDYKSKLAEAMADL